MLLWVLVWAVVGVSVKAWPEGQPNCFINGTWSDPRGLETIRVDTRKLKQPQQPSEVIVVFHNTTNQLL